MRRITSQIRDLIDTSDPLMFIIFPLIIFLKKPD